ncbi:MAG: phosphoglycerate dehydrogenase [Solirubrobacteraceae bacterium]
MSGPTVLLTTTAAGRGLYDVAVRALAQAGLTVVDTGSERPDEPTLARLAASVDAILATLVPLNAAVIEAGAGVKIIAKVGAGTDNIDVAAATRRNIPVCNTPGANAESVADHVLALILAIARRLLPLDAVTRAGRGWEPWPPYLGEELGGKVLGILGFGRTGQAVARRARAFGMECRAYDPFAGALAPEATADVTLTALDELLAVADYVSLHVPLSDDTRALVGVRELALMKPTAVLINTSRGPVVDEPALVRALRAGGIRAAGLDVFADEPAVANPLFELDNVVLTPHVAGMTTEATANACRLAAESIVAALRGEVPPRMVNAVGA